MTNYWSNINDNWVSFITAGFSFDNKSLFCFYERTCGCRVLARQTLGFILAPSQTPIITRPLLSHKWLMRGMTSSTGFNPRHDWSRCARGSVNLERRVNLFECEVKSELVSVVSLQSSCCCCCCFYCEKNCERFAMRTSAFCNWQN